MARDSRIRPRQTRALHALKRHTTFSFAYAVVLLLILPAVVVLASTSDHDIATAGIYDERDHDDVIRRAMPEATPAESIQALAYSIDPFPADVARLRDAAGPLYCLTLGPVRAPPAT